MRVMRLMRIMRLMRFMSLMRLCKQMRNHWRSQAKLIFSLVSIVLGAEYLFYLKSIATYAPAFLGYNNSVLARVSIIVLALQLVC